MTNRPCVKSAELDQGKKLIGFGGLFGLKVIYEKNVTSSKQKPQDEGEHTEEMWQMTAKLRTGDVEQRSAQREMTNSRSRVTAEGNQERRSDFRKTSLKRMLKRLRWKSEGSG